MSHFPYAWCLWDVQNDLLQFSESFIKTLSIEPILKIEELFKRLNAGAFSPLAKAVQHLYEFGGNFNLNLLHEDKEFAFFGKTFDGKSLNTHFVLLTVQDITQKTIQERESGKIVLQLKTENELLHFLLNNAPIALWHRSSQGRITYCNTAYAGALNSSISKVVAESIEMVHQVNMYELSKQALIHAEKMVIRAHTVIEGHRRLLEISEIPLPDNRSTIGYAMDISEIESLEDSITQTNKAYKDILNALSIPIAVFGEDRRLSFYNMAYQQLFDLHPRLLEQSPTLNDILEDLRKRRKIQEYSNFQTHKKERNELFNNLLQPIEEISYLPDGRTLRIRISPYPLGGILFIFENITSQLGLERDVNTLMAVQKTTLDYLQEGIVVLGNEGKIRISNPAVYKIWNIAQDDNQNDVQKWLQTLGQFFPDQSLHQSWVQQLSKCFSERHALSERLYIKDNKVIDWSYVPLPDGSHMLAFIDISDEWKHEQSLKAKNMNLEMNHRLKSDYIEKISQDLQKPLEDILGFSNTLCLQIFGSLNEKQMDYSLQIQKNTEELKNIFETALESISFDQGKLQLQKQKIDLESFFNNFEKYAIQKASACSTTVVVSKTIKLNTISADEKRINQALLNILNYFIKNTAHGTDIHINVDASDEGLNISFRKENATGHINHNFGKNIAKLIVEKHDGNFEEGIDKGLHWIHVKI